MTDKDTTKAIHIRAIVHEWEGEGSIEVDSVQQDYFEQARVRITTDDTSIEVHAADMIRAIKACAGFFDD